MLRRRNQSHVAGCTWLILLGVVLFALAGPVAVRAVEGEVVFFDDFAANAVGDRPAGWFVNADYVTVVEDKDVPSGKAVQMLGNPNQYSSWYVVLSVDTPVLVVEHGLKRVQGNRGINFYLDDNEVSRSGQHNVNWFLLQNRLMYRYVDGAGVTREVDAGALRDGWNHIRIVAHADRNEAYVYLNDMDKPAVGPLPFRTSLASGVWKDVRVWFWDTGNVDERTELYFSDVRVYY